MASDCKKNQTNNVLCLILSPAYSAQILLGNFLRQLHIHTYHSRFIPKGVAEASQIFLRDTHVLPKLVSYEEQCRRDKW
jgi:hypothetical protein